MLKWIIIGSSLLALLIIAAAIFWAQTEAPFHRVGLSEVAGDNP